MVLLWSETPAFLGASSGVKSTISSGQTRLGGESNPCLDEAIQRTRVFLDMHDRAMKDAGEIVQALANIVSPADDIERDLFDLTHAVACGSSMPHEIALFKPVDCSLEYHIAAEICAGGLALA
jgi:ornithine cyclodeaminase/alanine dehydrogenase-like protein (mu-crystallin family)